MISTCIVTGATAGIGSAIARGLSREKHHVVLVGRNSNKLTRAANEATALGASRVTQVLGDLGTVAGAKEVAHSLGRLETINVVIHCAGIWPTEKRLTTEGLEEAFTVNHLAPFVINQRLMPPLASSGRARIVQVSAGLCVAGRIDLEGDPTGAGFHPLRTYATTKLWNLLATKRLVDSAPSNIAISMVHPGVIRTALGDRRGLLGVLLRAVKRLWKSPEQGAAAPLALALKPEFANLRGAYFDEMKETALVAPANDVELARRVVETTNAVLGTR